MRRFWILLQWMGKVAGWFFALYGFLCWLSDRIF